MKRKSLLFLLLLALMAPWAAKAQETLTVYDQGTTTNSYVPIYGLFCDNGVKCEFVIPSTELEAMSGGTISAMKFYLASVGSSTISPSFTIFVKEVGSTTLSAYSGTSGATTVFNNTFTFTAQATNVEIDIPFSEDYTYEGGNLLIGVYQNGTTGYTSTSWTGVSQSYNSAWRGYGSSTGSGAAFLPKTTFTYEPASTGGCTKPETCVASDVTSTSATLTWSGGSGTYNVEIKGGDYTDWTPVLQGTNLTTTTLTLQPITSYQARVQSVCDGDTPTSGWRTCASFTTLCGAISNYPWTENFDSYSGSTSGSTNNLPQCWHYINGTTYSYYSGYPIVYNNASASYSGNNHLYFYSYYSSSYSYTPLYAILPEMENLNGMQLTLYAKAYNANSSFTVGMMTDPTDATTFVPIDTKTPSTSQYEEFIFTLGQGNYVAIKMEAANSSSSYRGIRIDNIKIDVAPACAKPAGLQFVSATSTAATLSWTNGSTDQTAWQIAYSTNAAFNPDEVTPVDVNSNPGTITGLTPSTNYYAYVRANCGNDGYSEWSASYLNFATECEVVTIPTDGWTENFDDYDIASTYTPSSRTLPLCWNYINTCTYSDYKYYPTIYYYSYTDYSHSTPNCLRFYSAYSSYYSYDPKPQYAILPEMNNLEGKRIKLWARGYSATSTFKIGRMTDPENTGTFVQIGDELGFTSSNYSTYQEFTIELTGTGNYIAIMIDAATSSRSSNGVYIDDIRVEPIPTCTEPSDLVFNSATTTTAEIGWTAGGNEQAWDIYYSTTNTAPNSTTAPSVSAIANNPGTITGLTASTKYYVWVRAHCSDTDQSPWIGGISFITKCEPTTIDADHYYTENFDSYTGSTNTSVPTGYPNDELPLCWEFLNRSENSSTYPLVFISSNSGYPVSGNCLFFRSSNTTPLYAILPEFDEEIANLQLNFTYRNEGTGAYNGTLIVGYMTNPMDATTFDTVLVCSQTTTLTEMEVLFGHAPAGSQIAFKYQGGTSSNYYLAIDNVKVDLAPTCIKPTSLAVVATELTANKARLTWVPGAEGQTQWQICLNGDEDNLIFVEQADTTYTLTGLEPDLTYTVKIRAYCNADADGQSYWSNETSFHTFPECVAPINLTCSNVTTSKATLSWFERGTATQWNVRIESNGNFIRWASTRPNSNPSLTIQNLDEYTSYTVRVFPWCDTINSGSDPITFTTLEGCPAPTDFAATRVTGHNATVNWSGDSPNYIVGYRTASYMDGVTETFGTSIPTGWEIKTGLLSSILDGGELTAAASPQWNFGTGNGVFDNHAKLNIYGTICKSWLITPEITVGDNYEMSFDLALTAYSGTGAASGTREDDRFIVLISIDDEATWTILREWNNEEGSTYVYNDIPTAGEKVTIDLSDYMGENVRIAFYGESTTSNGDNNIHIDNVAIGAVVAAGDWTTFNVTNTLAQFTELTPETDYEAMVQSDCGNDNLSHETIIPFTTLVSCPNPTTLAANNVGKYSVDLSWSENGDAEAWQLCWNGDEEHLIDVYNNPLTIDTLRDNTRYTVKVRANCGENETSGWSNTVSFTTLIACPAPTAFAADTLSSHEATMVWKGTSENYIVSYRLPGLDAVDEEFSNTTIPTGWTRYSGALNEDGTGPTSTITYGWNFGTNYFNSSHAYMNLYGTNKYWLVTPSFMAGNNPLSFDVAYTAYNSTSAAAQNGTDDRFLVLISTDEKEHWTILREWNNAGSPYVLNNIPATFQTINDIDLSAYAGQTAYIAFYGSSTTTNADNHLRIDNVQCGDPVAPGQWMNFTTTDTTYTFTDLLPETLYEARVISDCGDVDGMSVETTTTFTTGIACFAPTNLVVSNIDVESAVLSWTAAGEDQTEWQICLNGDMEHLIAVTDTIYTLEGLTQDSTYSVMVRANCGEYDGYSQWSDAVSFTTLEACLTPTNLTINNITGHTATMNWEGICDNYIVGYRPATYLDGTTEEFNGSSLPTGWTRYSGTLNSDGTASLSSYSYSWYIGTKGSMFDSHAYMNLYVDDEYSYWYDPDPIDYWMVTPSMTLSEGYALNFDAAYTGDGSYSTNPVTGCTTHRFAVLISTDNKAHWTILREWNNSGSGYVLDNISPNGQTMNIDLSAYAGETAYIAFFGHAESSYYDNYIHVDNVSIGQQIPAGIWETYNTADTTYTFTGLDPETIYDVMLQGDCGEGSVSHVITTTFTTDVACHTPVLAAVADSTITTTGATLTWTGDSPAYKLSYRVVDAETWEELTVDGTTYTFTNLTPATMYEAKVQGDCGEDGLSEESNVVSFTTSCEIYTITARTPYFQDFESPVVTSTYNSVTGAMLPVCWGEPYTTNTSYTYANPHIIKAGASYNYANEGQVLYFYGSGYGYAALPEFTNNLNELLISFKYATESNSYGTLTLGYITDEDVNYNTFTAIQTYAANSDSYHTLYEIKNVDLSSVPANATRLVFRWYYTSWYGCDIDDVKVTLKVVANKEITGYGENNDKWYLIANPLEEAVNPAEIEGMIPTISDEVDYDLYAYEQVTPADFEWQNYKGTNGFGLVNGMGYLYANKVDTILTFVGAPYSGDGRFPLAYNADAFAPGWNLLGNPFNENAYIDRDFYVMNMEGTNIIAGHSYIAPMEGVFVVADGANDTVTFTRESEHTGVNPGPGMGDDPFEDKLVLNLTGPSTSSVTTVIDRVIVRFGEGRQLPKLQLSENSSSLCIPQNGSNYAVVTSTGNGEMPLNFKAEKAGTYTISFSNENVSFSYLHIIDNVTHTEVDLLGTLSYSFETQAGNFANRFTIVYEVK